MCRCVRCTCLCNGVVGDEDRASVLRGACAFVVILDTAFRLSCELVIVCMLDTLLLSVGPVLLSSVLLRNRNPLLPQSGKVNVSITHHCKYT